MYLPLIHRLRALRQAMSTQLGVQPNSTRACPRPTRPVWESRMASALVAGVLGALTLVSAVPDVTVTFAQEPTVLFDDSPEGSDGDDPDKVDQRQGTPTDRRQESQQPPRLEPGSPLVSGSVGIEVGDLPDPRVAIPGLETAIELGLPDRLTWPELSLKEAAERMQRLPSVVRSSTLRLLARDLLVEAGSFNFGSVENEGEVPENREQSSGQGPEKSEMTVTRIAEDADYLNQVRFDRLARLGFFEDADALAERLDFSTVSDDLAWKIAEFRLARHDLPGTCELFEQIGESPITLEWRKLFAFCDALRDRRDSAEFTAAVLSEITGGEGAFFSLLNRMLYDTPLPEGLDKTVGLVELAMMRYLSAAPPPALAVTKDPLLLASWVDAPDSDPGLLIEAAGRARRLGLVPNDRLVRSWLAARYEAVDLDRPVSRSLEMSPEQGLSLLYQAYLRETSSAQRGELLIATFDLADQTGMFAEVAQAYSDSVLNSERSGLNAFPFDKARALVAVGEPSLAVLTLERMAPSPGQQLYEPYFRFAWPYLTLLSEQSEEVVRDGRDNALRRDLQNLRQISDENTDSTDSDSARDLGLDEVYILTHYGQSHRSIEDVARKLLVVDRVKRAVSASGWKEASALVEDARLEANDTARSMRQSPSVALREHIKHLIADRRTGEALVEVIRMAGETALVDLSDGALRLALDTLRSLELGDRAHALGLELLTASSRPERERERREQER